MLNIFCFIEYIISKTIIFVTKNIFKLQPHQFHQTPATSTTENSEHNVT